MFTAAILSFNAAWGDFFWPLLVLKDRSVYTIMVEVYTVQQNIAQDQALIILTFAIIPPAIMFVFFQKYIMQGMTMSGIKG
jgi:multiple sugar transport system permease protein